MHYRELGRTGWKVSEVSFGAWAIGGAWGSVDDSESLAALNKAIDLGVNFIDTADVYGDGHSEQLIAQVLKSRREEVIVATKAGRRLDRRLQRR
jgi:aryl-alcohol dehydrogenase-like predicted oxidoreductase